MNSTLANELTDRFADPDYARAYMEEFVNASIATQIKVLREQRGLTQEQLATLANMKQGRISALEDVDYGSWTIATLRRIADALDVVLKVSFETFGSSVTDVASFSRANLQRDGLKKSIKSLAEAPKFSKTDHKPSPLAIPSAASAMALQGMVTSPRQADMSPWAQRSPMLDKYEEKSEDSPNDQFPRSAFESLGFLPGMNANYRNYEQAGALQ